MRNQARLHKFLHDLNQLCKRHDLYLTPQNDEGGPLDLHDSQSRETVAVLSEREGMGDPAPVLEMEISDDE